MADLFLLVKLFSLASRSSWHLCKSENLIRINREGSRKRNSQGTSLSTTPFLLAQLSCIPSGRATSTGHPYLSKNKGWNSRENKAAAERPSPVLDASNRKELHRYIPKLSKINLKSLFHIKIIILRGLVMEIPSIFCCNTRIHDWNRDGTYDNPVDLFPENTFVLSNES